MRFALPGASGLGTVIDRTGALWDRAGRGRLNRYAVDGRLLGCFRIPDRAEGHDQITLVGDLLVLLIGKEVLVLPIEAAPGSEATSLLRDVRALSPGSRDGRVAVARPGPGGAGNELLLLDPRSGATNPVATIGDGVEGIELAPDGAVHPLIQGRIHRYVQGRTDSAGWPRTSPGDRPQLLTGRWYGHGWHSTIRRFDDQPEPAPGVVFGGASGSFIGHLDQNSELINGRGLASLRDDLFAASGFTGVLQLLAWHGDRQQFAAVRRIGAIPACTGLGLDRSGNVYHWSGVWEWSWNPDASQRSGVNAPSSLGQAVMLDDERMIAPGFLWDRPTFYRGALTGEVATQRIDGCCELSRTALGSAVYPAADGKEPVLLTLEAGAGARAFRISAWDGASQADLGAVELATATPVQAFTTLAMRSPDTLLAGADGAVTEFARNGSGWKGQRRWASWGGGPGDRFDSRITIAGDARSLAVADTERRRVLCFDLASGALRCAIGIVDDTGTGLGTFDGPTTIAVRDRRLVVYDQGNQRLVKLRLVD